MQRKTKLNRLLLCVALQSVASTALAQDQAAPLARPFGECAAGYWVSSRNLDDTADITNASCLLNWKPKLSANASVGFSARVGSKDQSDTQGSSLRVREAYLDLEDGALLARLGRQIVAWGRADRVNPTDSLSPRDFTLLVADDEEQRMGIDALQLRYALNSNLSISTLLARFEPHITPQGSLPPNRVAAPVPEAVEWAVKLDHVGAGVDWSVSYFNGYDRSARYQFDARNASGPVFRADFERTQTLGFDVAGAVGAWTLRAEASHSWRQEACSACPAYQRTVSRAVLGADRDLMGTMNLNLQVFGIARTGFTSIGDVPAALRNVQAGLNRLNTEYADQETGITLRLSDRLLNDKLKWELGAVFDLTGASSLIKPRLTYAVNDQIKLSAGMDIYTGHTQTYFGALGKNALAFASVSFVF
jgi:hypothetical protein